MNNFLKSLSIKKKLLLILVFSSLCGLLLATLFLLVFEIAEFKQNTQDDLSAMAELIGNRSTAALMFDDQELAKENLASLEALPSFQSACIYNQNGKVFTSFKASVHTKPSCPEQYDREITYFDNTLLYVYKPIFLDADALGTVFILADLEKTFIRKFKFISLLVIVLFAATFVTFLLTIPLLKWVTTPLARLLDTVKMVTQKKDYSQRAIKKNNDELGQLVDAFNSMISTVEKQNLALTVAKDHYLALYDDNPTMVFNLSADGSIISVNSFGAKQLDLTTEELQGCSIYDFVHIDDRTAAMALLNSCLEYPMNVHKDELRKVCRNERIIWVRETARLVKSENQQHNFLLVCEDVTEARKLSEKIAYQASHDALTGLVNRNEFDSVIQLAVKNAKKENREHALCYLDLDQFKVVNDMCGHLAGDELLRQLGDVLRIQIRKGDVLARLGGDEFGVFMNDCTLDDAYHACEKLKNVIGGFQFAWQDRSYFLGVSIGISSINSRTANAVEIMKEADAACYAAKDKGRNRVHVYRPDDEELASRKGEMVWVERIQRGIEASHFTLYGQIIVPTSGIDEGLHFEVLLRHHDDDNEGEVIPPGAFLPAAERYNVAPALDKWVISNLFRWLAQHQENLATLSLCSINLSGLSLSDESMLDFIYDAFDKYQIPSKKICFEITETAAIGNLTYATKFISQLRQRGCLFSLDDFGCGLSSFAYLKNLPVDTLKIDGIFVKDILEDPVNLSMVRSINEVGHVMGKKTVAEFVENKQILEVLKELDVDYVQGYGIAKPVPLEELF